MTTYRLDKTSSYFEAHKDEPAETGGFGWYLQSAGYTAMIAAAVIGPGTLSAMVKGGAIYPWKLGWAVLLSAVFCWIASYAGARTTMLTGRGSIELLRDELHPLFMWIVLAGCSFSMLVVGWFEGVAIGASMQLLTGINIKLAAWIFSIILGILYVIRSDIKFAIWVT